MSKLFETTRIKSLTMPNRFVRSATFEAMANTDGSPRQLLVDTMAKLAAGGVGLVVSGISYAQKEGQAIPLQLGVHSDILLPGLSQMTEAVHGAGGRIAIQIAHGGVEASIYGAVPSPVGPSVVHGQKGPACREMTREEIGDAVRAFGEAAARGKKAGFDAVQIHGAHGFLLSEFLSPYFNKRSDAYGGSLENRARIAVETIHSMRKAVGDQYPILIKVNSEDLLPGGLNVDDMLRAAVMFEDAGVDAIELSGGTAWGPMVLGDPEAYFAKTTQTEAYWLEATKRLKKTVQVPVMLVGGVRSYETAEQIVNAGTADYISLSRPLIREPDLVNRWKSGDTRRATCVSENACTSAERMPEIFGGKGIRCVHVKE